MCFALTLLVFSPVHADPLGDALTAYNGCNFRKAFNLFKPLADQGDAVAQYTLGKMYVKGQGVLQDNKEAFSPH